MRACNILLVAGFIIIVVLFFPNENQILCWNDALNSCAVVWHVVLFGQVIALHRRILTAHHLNEMMI